MVARGASVLEALVRAGAHVDREREVRSEVERGSRIHISQPNLLELDVRRDPAALRGARHARQGGAPGHRRRDGGHALAGSSLRAEGPNLPAADGAVASVAPIAAGFRDDCATSCRQVGCQPDSSSRAGCGKCALAPVPTRRTSVPLAEPGRSLFGPAPCCRCVLRFLVAGTPVRPLS